MMLLELRGLRASYDKVDVLEDIDITVNEGEVVAIIGPNGAGKSTALKAIFGLVKVTAGSVFFQGKEITNHRPREVLAGGISYIPQGKSVFPSLTVIENLEMGGYTLGLKRDIEERIENIYNLFPQLKERKNQIAGTLSGGEQQMLVLGRAMMLNPKLLLVDEPSLGLAPVMVDLVLDKITEINRHGVTIVVVEQKVSDVLEISHRAYVLEMGRVTMEDAAFNLLNNEVLKQKYLSDSE